jgi:hypothetical protein
MESLLETVDVTIDILFEIRHPPAPVDQEQAWRDKSADFFTSRRAYGGAAIAHRKHDCQVQKKREVYNCPRESGLQLIFPY